MLGDEAEHPPAVFRSGVGALGEVLGVHPEDPRHVDLALRVVDPAVPLAGQELPGRGAEGFPDAVRRVGLGAHRRAAVGGAVDHEVDPRLPEAVPEDPMLDLVQADPDASGDVASPLEELAVPGLPHRADRVLLDHGGEHEGVVRVDPVRQRVLGRRERLRRTVGAGGRQGPDEPVEELATLGEDRVVDLAVRRHDGRQELGPGRVVEERGRGGHGVSAHASPLQSDVMLAPHRLGAGRSPPANSPARRGSRRCAGRDPARACGASSARRAGATAARPGAARRGPGGRSPR